MLQPFISELPPKIAGLYKLRGQNILVPEFAEVFCSIQNVSATIEQVLENFSFGNAGVSVRSASSSEDTNLQANAGRFLSFNGLNNKDQIITAASAILDDHYNKTNQQNCYLIIQQTIASVFSGVAFASFNSGLEMEVESFFGSCRTIVDGAVIPYRSVLKSDHWQHHHIDEPINIFTVHPAVFDKTDFNNIEPGSLLQTSLSDFPRMPRWFSATSDLEIKVYARLPLYLPEIYKQQIANLATIAEKLHSEYPNGIDMEWGVDAQGKLYVFQVRAITSPLLRANVMAHEKPSIADGGMLNGIPASEGQVSGIILHENSTIEIPAGTKRILMLHEATVHITDTLDTCAGVISVLGGMLCHLAIVCREKSIPCIVGVHEMIPEGSGVSIDGKTGIITIDKLAE